MGKSSSKKKQEDNADNLYHIVIVGGGIGGGSVAAGLVDSIKEEKCKVTLIDRGNKFAIGACYQYIFSGKIDSIDSLHSKISDMHLPGVNIQANSEVTDIDFEAKTVTTSNGKFTYDTLVLSPGVQHQSQIIPSQELQFNICDGTHAIRIREAIQACQPGSKILVTIPAGPYKCPPAPFEFVFMIDDMLRTKGIRDEVELGITSPKPFPFGGAPVKKTFLAVCEEKKINYYPEHIVQEISGDANEKTVTFKNGEKLSANVLLGPYPQKAPELFAKLKLTNEKGFVPVDLFTNKSEEISDMFCIGDASWMSLLKGDGEKISPPKPHPKSGTFAQTQAEGVVAQIKAKLDGGEADENMDLFTSRCGQCYADAGGDKGILLDVTLYRNKCGPPKFVCEMPSEEAHQKKLSWIIASYQALYGSDANPDWLKTISLVE